MEDKAPETVAEANGKVHASKPGYKSTEFWLSTVATIAGLVIASGAIAEGSTAATIVGGIVALLSTMGYTGSRSGVKKAAAGKK